MNNILTDQFKKNYSINPCCFLQAYVASLIYTNEFFPLLGHERPCLFKEKNLVKQEAYIHIFLSVSNSKEKKKCHILSTDIQVQGDQEDINTVTC